MKPQVPGLRLDGCRLSWLPAPPLSCRLLCGHESQVWGAGSRPPSRRGSEFSTGPTKGPGTLRVSWPWMHRPLCVSVLCPLVRKINREIDLQVAVNSCRRSAEFWDHGAGNAHSEPDRGQLLSRDAQAGSAGSSYLVRKLSGARPSALNLPPENPGGALEEAARLVGGAAIRQRMAHAPQSAVDLRASVLRVFCV